MTNKNFREAFETAIIGTVLMHPSLGKSMIDKLKDYKFNADYRNEFYRRVKKMLNKTGELSDAFMLSLMTDKKDFNNQLTACMPYSDSINFQSNIAMLIDGQIYNKLAGGYIEYLNRIDKEDAIENIVSDNMSMLLKIDIDSNSAFNISQNELVTRMLTAVQEKTYGEKVYLTGDIELDEFLQISKRNIILIGGKSGALKTKLSMKIIQGLLHNNTNISVLHYAMEDSAEQITRGYVAMKLHLMDEELSNRGYQMSREESLLFQKELKKISEYDIEYVNKASYINDIGAHFMRFQAKRKNRFCLLIIDNFMKIQDQFKFNNSVKADDYIASVIDSWNIKTSNEEMAIIILHHFIDEQISKQNKEEAYRPTEKDFRGSTRIRDMSTKVILTNYIGNYPQLHGKFAMTSHTIRRLYIIEFVKNRLGGLGMLRYIAFPEFNRFFNLNEIA